jgi:hypothetical protein
MKEHKRIYKIVKRQSSFIKALEGKYPGITRVKRNASGEIILDNEPDQRGWNILH